MTGRSAVDVPAAVAGSVFLLGLLVWTMWRLVAPPVDAPRSLALAIEDPTDDPTDDLTPYLCPDCGRNAGHNEGCAHEPTLGRAALAIEIPREGEAQ